MKNKKDNTVGVALVKEVCIVCTKEMDGPIIMNTILTKKHAEEIESMHGKVVGFAEKPCHKCMEMIENAFVLIGIDERKSDLNNLPEGFYRTGQIIGIKKDSNLAKDFQKQVPSSINTGYIFVDESILKNLGLIQQ